MARALAEVAHEDVTLYLAGGATAVIEGWRPTTIDVDLRLEPDTDALMRRIVTAKSELDINVEGFAKDLDDVAAMIGAALIDHVAEAVPTGSPAGPPCWTA